MFDEPIECPKNWNQMTAEQIAADMEKIARSAPFRASGIKFPQEVLDEVGVEKLQKACELAGLRMAEE